MRILLVCAAALSPGLAAACGGFFCDRSRPAPPVQSSERIIFVQEPGQMTALVQIQYQGAADSFAWVVPVPAVPELDTADPALFDSLDAATAPQFTFKFSERTETYSDSGGGGFGCSGDDSTMSLGSEVSESETTRGEVQILGREAVGPYDTVIIDSDDPRAMVDWLQANGYPVADRAAEVFRDYVERDHYFVALKLRSQLGVDALEPLAIRYAGTEPCIPLRITAFASVPQLTVTAFVIGDGRAVPTNFDHVRPDYQDVRPVAGMTTYPFVVTGALDGHPRAFITELAGPTSAITVTNEAARRLLDRGRYITRLFTRIRPADMTMDPMFEIDPDARNVSNLHLIDLRDDPAYAQVIRQRVDTSVAGPLALPVLVLLVFVGLRRRSST